MKKKVVFIINPKAGRKKRLQPDVEIRSVMAQYSDDFEFVIELTKLAGHATSLSERYAREGVDLVYAVGGDGTVNEVAQGLVNSPTPMAILPLGSGNGLSRHLKIPFNIRENLKELLFGKIEKIDTCELNGSMFVSIAGVGFDAFVAEHFAKMSGRGLINYIKASVKYYFSYQPKRYKIKCNQTVYAGKALFISLANSNQFGYNASIAPQANLQDGLLNVCLLKKIPWYKAPVYIPKLFNGTLMDTSYLEIIPSNSMEIYLKEIDSIHLDGDPVLIPQKILKVHVLPKSLNICVPQNLKSL